MKDRPTDRHGLQNPCKGVALSSLTRSIAQTCGGQNETYYILFFSAGREASEQLLLTFPACIGGKRESVFQSDGIYGGGHGVRKRESVFHAYLERPIARSCGGNILLYQLYQLYRCIAAAAACARAFRISRRHCLAAFLGRALGRALPNPPALVSVPAARCALRHNRKRAGQKFCHLKTKSTV